MTSIDERIVALKFDNAQFQSGAQSALDTLNKLKQSVNLKGAASQGLGILGRFGAKFAHNKGIDVFRASVDQAKNSFSALEVMGITALANITNSAVNAGKQLAHAFTVQPVKDGFAEYELKMNSVQTIMASTGEDIKTVNKYLEELNQYADKTIYSFSDMTQNIGKFTNAGVPLEDAVKAIQGISNEAAISGANANQASHAMYNFAQALSQGSVKLIDWKSIEIAQMATKEFKQELINTALEIGTLVKEGDMYKSTTKDLRGHTSEAFTATKMFNESLSSQWMTTDVLVKTLGKYADMETDIGKRAFAAAQDVKTFSQLMDTLKEAAGSGWARTFELIFGDKEEAKTLWTRVNNALSPVIEGMSTARNTMFEVWDQKGGRKDFIEGIAAAYRNFGDALKPIKEAFRDIFPPMTGEKLAELTKRFRNFTENLKLTKEQSQNLKDTFRGIFTIFKIIGSAIGSISQTVAPVIGSIANLLLSFTGSIGRVIADAESLGEVFSGLKGILDDVADGFKSVIDSLAVPLPKGGIIESIKGFFSSFSGLDIGEIIGQIGSVFASIATGIKDSIVQQFSGMTLSEAVNKLLTVGIFAGLTKTVKNLSKFTGQISNAVESLFKPLDSVSGIFEETKNTLKSWQRELNASMLLKLAGAIAVLAMSLKIISTIEPEELSKSLGAISTMMLGLIAGIAVLDKMEFNKIGGASAELLSFAVAIGILAIALKSISELNIKDISKGLFAIGGLMFMLVKAMTIMNTVGGAELKNVSKKFLAVDKVVKQNPFKGVLAFVIAIAILCEELQRIGKMDLKSILKGLFGIGAIMAELLVAAYMMKSLDISFKGFKSSGILVMAAAVYVFAQAMEVFGRISPQGILQGIISMEIFISSYIALLGSLEIFTKETSGGKVLAAAAGLLIIAEAFKIFATAMTAFDGMDWSTTIMGLTSFAVMIGGMIVAMNALGNALKGGFKSSKLITLGAAMLIISESFKIFSDAMSSFEAMDWSSTLQGLMAFAGLIGGVTTSLAVISKLNINPATMMSLAITMLGISAAMVILAEAFKGIRSAGFEGVSGGLISLAGVLTIIGVAGSKMNPALIGKIAAITVVLIGLSAALVIMASAFRIMNSVGMMGVIGGLAALAGTLTVFAVAANLIKPGIIVRMAGLAGVFLVLGAAITIFAPAMLLLSSIPIMGAVAALTALAGTLAVFGIAASVLTPVIPQMYLLVGVLALFGGAVALFGVGVLAISDGIIQLTKAITQFAKLTGNTIKKAGDNFALFITSIATVILSATGEIVTIFTTVVTEMLKALLGMVPELVNAGAEIILALLDGLVQNIPEIISKGAEVVTTFCGAVAQNTGQVIDSGINLIFSLIKGMGDGLNNHQSDITAAVSSLVSGLSGAIGAAIEGVLNGIGAGIGDAIGNILSGAMSSLPQVGEKLSEFAEEARPFLEEMSGFDSSVMQGVLYLSEAIAVLTASNLVNNNIFSRLLTAGSSIADLGDMLWDFSDSISGIYVDPSTLSSVSTIVSIIKMASEAAKDIPNSGGLLGNILGNNDIDKFGKMVSAAATSFATVPIVNSTVLTSVTMILKTIKSASEIAKGIPNTDGMLGDIFGNNDIRPFVEQIAGAARSFSMLSVIPKFNDNLVNNIKTTVDIIKKTSDIAKTLPKTGGFDQVFTGTPNIDPFVDIIKSSVTSLSRLSTVNEIDAIYNNEDFFNKLTVVMSAVKRIIKVAADIGTITGGAIGNFIKSKIDIPSVVTKIKDMVKAVKNISKISTDGLDMTALAKLNVIKSALTNLSEVSKSVKSVKIDKSASASGLIMLGKNLKKAVPYFVGFTAQASRVKSANAEKVKNVINIMKSVKGAGDGASFKKLGVNIKSLGHNMAEFSSTMDGVDAGAIAQKLTDIAKIEVDGSHFEAFGKVVKRSLTNAIKAVNNSVKNFKTAGTKCAKAMVAGAKSQAKQMSAAGKNAGSKFVSGVKSKVKSARSAGKSLASAAKSGASGGYSDMYSIGQNLGQGVVDGLNSMLDDVNRVSGQIADEVDKAIRKKGEIHSPSKRTMRDGEYMGKGFAIGIEKTKKRVSDASKKVAEDGFRQFKLAYNPAVAVAKKFEKDITTVWGRINKVLSKVTKATKNTIYSLSKKDIFGGFIKDSKSVSKYLPNLTKQFSKQFNSKSIGLDTKTVSKTISNYRNKLKRAYKSLEQAQKDYNKYSFSGKKSNNKYATFALAEVRFWESVVKKLEKLAPKVKKLQAMSKVKSGSTVLNNFAMRLYMQSDDYKNSVKQLNSNSKAYNKALKNQNKAEIKARKAQDKVDKLTKKRNKARKRGDDDAIKKYEKQLKEARRAMQQANQEVTNARKTTDNAAKTLKKSFDAMAKGAEKALKSFRANIKAYVKDVANLSNIQLPEPLFSGFNVEVDTDKAVNAFDAFSSAAAKGLKTVSNGLYSLSDTAKTAISAASEAYDILSNTSDIGINLFEKFTKTGTAEPRALIEIADTQLDAYEELYNGLDKMQKMGFSQDLIDTLEAQGINGLNYVRGFLSMGEEEMAEYAAIMDRKQKYEDEARMRNMEKQAREYATWMSNIDDVLAKTVGTEFIKKLKAAGVTNANFVAWLVRLPAEALKNVESYYLKSISDNVVEFTQEIPKTVSNAVAAVSSSGSSLLDNLLNTNSKNSKWDEDLAALASRGLSEHVIESLRQMGQDSAQVYVDELLATAENGSYKVGETVISQINEAMDKYDPDYTGSFVGALEKSVSDKNEWDNVLKKLEDLGFSKDVIEKFEGIGQDSGLAWAKSLLKEVGDIDSKLKAKLKEAQDYEAEARRLGNKDQATVDRVYGLWEEYYALDALKRKRIEYVNSLAAEKKENSIVSATKNMKSENDSYAQYQEDKKFFEDEIKRLRNGGHKTTADKYQAVYDALMEGGYESAGLVHDAVEAIKEETDAVLKGTHFASKTIFAFYDQLDRRNKINSKESWLGIKNFFPDVKDLQKNYGDLMDWATKHMFTNLDDKKKDKNGYTQRDRAIQEFLSQAESLGVDGAVELLQTMQWAFTNDKTGFNSVMKRFYETNFTVPNSVANKVTNDFAVAYEGAVGDFTKKLGTAITNMSKTITKNVTKAVGPIGNSGKEIGKKITSSVKASTDELRTTLPKTITSKKFINTVTTSGKTVGKAISTGMANGISNNSSKITDAAEDVAKEALKAAKKALGIKSPSKAFAEIGRYVDEGFAKGLDENASIPMTSMTMLSDSMVGYMAGAASMIADQVNQDVVFDPDIVVDESKAKALDTMRSAIEAMIMLANDEIDTNPVITPELDLADVRKSAQEMASMVDDTQAKLTAPALDSEIQNGSNQGVTYIQNNYSPKALSPLEIYRQSENLIARTRGMVKAL